MLLSAIVTDICSRAGITSSLIDVTALTDDVIGFQIPRQMPARTALETLMVAYNFEATEVDWLLKFVKRGGASVATLAVTDLRAHPVDSTPPDRAVEVRIQDLDLPTHFTLSYESMVRDYEIASQNAVRVDKSVFLQKSTALGLVMSDTHAKQQAEILLKMMWASRHKFTFSTTRKFLKLAPGDPITVAGKGMRVTEMNHRFGVLDFVCDSEGDGVYTSGALADDLTIGATDLTQAAYIPLFLAMDIPALSEDFGNAGLTFAMYGVSGSYTGGTIQRSTDGGVTWSDVWFFPATSAKVGVCTDTLADGTQGILDNSVEVTVNLAISSGTLANATDGELAAGANLVAIGSIATGWEILQYKTATLVSGNTYTLSGLWRGLYGTARFMPTHGAAESFVFLSGLTGVGYGVDFISAQTAAIGVSYLYRAKNASDAVGAATALTTGGMTLECYPAIEANIEYDSGTLDCILTWKRGDRYGFIDPDYPDGLPASYEMSELAEAYEVDVIDLGDNSVIRAFTATTPTITYTAAQQITDGIPSGPITFNIYQMSGIVGRGIPFQITG